MWQYGRAWQPSYPHLQPKHGRSVKRQDPRLEHYFPTEGVVLGKFITLIKQSPLPPLDYAELVPIGRRACRVCFAEALLFCNQCLQPYCSTCWHSSARQGCSAHPFCKLAPDHYCSQQHPICSYHIDDQCQVCCGRVASEHCSEHSYTTLRAECACGTVGSELCLNCGVACCSRCRHTCDRPALLCTDPRSESQWESFATLYPFSVDLKDGAEQCQAHAERVLEFVDFMLLQWMDSDLAEVDFLIETLGPLQTLQTEISKDWLEDTFAEARELDIAACRLLCNTERGSSFGQIAMACFWFDGQCSFHWVAREPKELMRQLHSAYCASVYFPVWFFQQHLPVLLVKETTKC